MELLKKIRPIGITLCFGCTLLFFSASGLAGNLGNEISTQHVLRIHNIDSTDTALSFQYVQDTSEPEPGIYFIGDYGLGNTKAFPTINQRPAWDSEHNVELARRFKMAEEEHPVRILLSNYQGKTGAVLLAEFFEHAKNSYELSFNDKPEFNRHVKKTISAGKASAHFIDIEKVLSARQVTILNKETDETENLSDFVDHLIALKQNSNFDVAAKLSEFNNNLRKINGQFRDGSPDVAGNDVREIGLDKKWTYPALPSPDNNNLDTNPVYVPFDPLAEGSGF